MPNRIVPLAAALWMAFGASIVQAEEKQASALAREVIELAGADQTMTQSIVMQEDMLKSMIRQQKPEMSPEDADRFWALFTEELQQVVPKMLNEIALLYDEHFTQQDLQNMADFYRTPTGSKLMALQSGFMADAGQISERFGAIAMSAATTRYQAEKE